MKHQLTKHYCMDKTCGYEETSHKVLDGRQCPRCNGPIMSEKVKRKKG
jgi:predicted Zn-ribbon and HTH transcriptional regulator